MRPGRPAREPTDQMVHLGKDGPGEDPIGTAVLIELTDDAVVTVGPVDEGEHRSLVVAGRSAAARPYSAPSDSMGSTADARRAGT